MIGKFDFSSRDCYSPVPTRIADFLTEEEKTERKKEHAADFRLIKGTMRGYDENMSVARMGLEAESGCLVWGVIFAVLALIALIAVTYAALESHDGGGGFVGCFCLLVLPLSCASLYMFIRANKLDKGIALARKHEKERMRNGMEAEVRYIERRARKLKEEQIAKEKEALRLKEEQEKLQRQAEIEARKRREELERKKRQEEHARKVAEARKNAELMVNMIIANELPIGEFFKNIDKGDGHGFEDRLREFFNLSGYACGKVSNSSDQGVDLILVVDDIRYAIQCKFYSSNSVGNDAVQQVNAGKALYKCSHALVITNSNYTKSARILAQANKVDLLVLSDVVHFVQTLR